MLVGKTMEMWRRSKSKDNGNLVVLTDERPWKCGGGNGGGRQWNWVVGKTMGMWRWWKRKDIGNLVVLTDDVVAAVEERQWKCGGGNGGGTTTEMWRRWKRKDNGNLVVLTDERQRKCGGGGRKKTMEIW